MTKLTDMQLSGLLSYVASCGNVAGPCCDTRLLEKLGIRGRLSEQVHEILYCNGGCMWNKFGSDYESEGLRLVERYIMAVSLCLEEAGLA